MNIHTLIDFYNSNENQFDEDEAIKEFKKILRKSDHLVSGPVSVRDRYIEYLTDDKKKFHQRTLGIKTDIDFVKQKIYELKQIKNLIELKTVKRETDAFLSYAYTILSSRIEDNQSYLNELFPEETLESGEYIGTLTIDQKLVMLNELGVFDFLISKDCKYAKQKDGSTLSINKIAGILTEFVDRKQSTIQPSLNKLMSRDGTMTRSNIDSPKNEMMAGEFLKKLGLIKKA